MISFLMPLLVSLVFAGDSISPEPAARYHGNQGLRLQIPAQGIAFVQDDTPAGEKTYRARFYVNPDMLQASSAAGFHLFQGLDAQDQLWFSVRILEKEKALYLDLSVRQDKGDSIQLPLAEHVLFQVGYQSLEIAFAAQDGTGYIRLWLNGAQVAQIMDVQNNLAAIDKVRLGLAGSRTGTVSGRLDLDEFISRRMAYIGPLECVATSQLYAQVPLWETTATLLNLVALATEACPDI